MATLEAKAKIKIRHQEAITQYLKWLTDNDEEALRPTDAERYAMFNYFIDKSAKMK